MKVKKLRLGLLLLGIFVFAYWVDFGIKNTSHTDVLTTEFAENTRDVNDGDGTTRLYLEDGWSSTDHKTRGFSGRF